MVVLALAAVVNKLYNKTEKLQARIEELQELRLQDSKEPPSRQPVKWEHVEPVLAELSPDVRAMVLFQWHTGARSKSICLATPR